MCWASRSTAITRAAPPEGESATLDQQGIAAITQGLAKTGGASAVTPTGVSADRSLALVAVTPEAGPDHERTSSLVGTLRDPGAGLTAVNLDISHRLGEALPEHRHHRGSVTGILYGLAMESQVFLVTAMHEATVQGMSAPAAIVHGFEHSSRVVVAAAIIMVSVSAGFVFSDDPMIKQFGFALAVGVVIDTFLVRMTLVPAVVSLLGEHAW